MATTDDNRDVQTIFKTSKDSIDDTDAVNDYIHTYYEDTEELYREQIFKFGV